MVHVSSLSVDVNCHQSPSALRVECTTDAVPGRQRFVCGASNDIASVTCSFDGGAGENCSFPVVAEVDRFGTDNHTLVVTVVDVFGQSVDVSFNFTLTECKYMCVLSFSHFHQKVRYTIDKLPYSVSLAVVRVACSSSASPGSQTFNCPSVFPVASTTCSFDGGEQENCSFPLVVGFERFGSAAHGVVVTVVGVDGQVMTFSFNFTLTPRM